MISNVSLAIILNILIMEQKNALHVCQDQFSTLTSVYAQHALQTNHTSMVFLVRSAQNLVIMTLSFEHAHLAQWVEFITRQASNVNARLINSGLDTAASSATILDILIQINENVQTVQRIKSIAQNIENVWTVHLPLLYSMEYNV